MNVNLVVAKGKRQGEVIPIKADLFMMGSDRSCQLRSGMQGIGPQHCAIVVRDGKVFVRDLEGGQTILNEDVIPPGEEWPIHWGDKLIVGPLEFVVEYSERTAVHRDVDEWALKSLDHDQGKEPAAGGKVAPGVGRGGKPDAGAAAAAASILDKLQDRKGVVKGRLRVSELGDVTVMRFNDIYMVEEAEIAFIKKELLGNLTKPKMRILLDFQNVSRLSSAAAEMILDFDRRNQAKSGTLALCRVKPELHLILETLQIFPKIPHFNTPESAATDDW